MIELHTWMVGCIVICKTDLRYDEGGVVIKISRFRKRFAIMWVVQEIESEE